MGEANRKKKRRFQFLENNPFCCFCGGGVQATTVDHVPNRACFKGRQFPEGYEFPACGNCQTRTREEEQVFSYFVRASDLDHNNYDREQSQKAIRGLANNFPHLIPKFANGPVDVHRALLKLGQPIPITTPARDVPVVSYPVEVFPIVQKAISKIGCALFFKHTRRIVPTSYFTWNTWATAGDLKRANTINEIAKIPRKFKKGSRYNIDFGNQFQYKWDVSDDDSEEDIFIAVGSFGRGMLFLTSFIDSAGLNSLGDEDIEEWVRLDVMNNQL